MDTAAFIEKCRCEVLTKEELDSVKEWAPNAGKEALLKFIKEWTDHTAHSIKAENWKSVNSIVMPHVVQIFREEDEKREANK